MVKKRGENINKKIKILNLKVITNVIIATIFSSIAFGYIIYETVANKNTFIQSYKDEQQILVNEIAKESREILQGGELSETYYENLVIENVIEKAETSGSRYWIFAKNDIIIYMKNKEVTQESKGDIFSDDEEKGYVTSLKTFNINDNKYIVGLNTKEDYLLKLGGISKLNNSIYLFSSVFSLVVIGEVLYFSSKLKDKEENIKDFNALLKKRNIIIEEYTKNISKNEAEENLKDDLTKAYKEEILLKILDKINKQGILPVSILTFKVLGLEGLNDKVKSSNILQSTAGILRETINEKHVMARRNNDEFVIVLLESIGVEQSAFRILEKFNNQFNELNISLLFGISKRDGENQEIYNVLKNALDNLEKKKLHNQNLKERVL